MARGNSIIVSADPRGVYLEGIIGDTSKPGTIMQVQAATNMLTGRFTWVQANLGTAGLPAIMAVLLEDSLQGKTVSDAYVAGTYGKLYCPAPGEDMNVLLSGSGATGTFNIADRLMIASGNGYMIPVAGTYQSSPFFMLEALTAVTLPFLGWTKYTGH